MIKVYWEELPRKIHKGKLCVDWLACVGCSCKFIYEDISGDLLIKSYNTSSNVLQIKYKEYDVFEVHISNFKKCQLGRVLNKINIDFKIDIGHLFKDDKRDLIITDRDYRKRDTTNQQVKWYKYSCNKCGWTEGWIEESNLISHKVGCGCCCTPPHVVVSGINDMNTTSRWMVELGVDEEFAKSNFKSTRKNAPIKCPHCGNTYFKKAIKVYACKSIACICGDGFSFSEKLLFSVLEQLKMPFQCQLSKSTFNWCDKYRYDFYIPSVECIIETHGIQHYEEKNRNGAKSLMDEQLNDSVKQVLASSNGVKNYIILDCRKSDLEFIKENILNSELSKLCDLSEINWNKAGKYAMGNLSKKVCDLWNEGNNGTTTKDISDIMHINRTTITKWLKNWANIGLCNYNPKEESKKSGVKTGLSLGKEITLIKNGIPIHTFCSCNDLVRNSERLMGVKFQQTNIMRVLSGTVNKHKGYTFEYTNNQ